MEREPFSQNFSEDFQEDFNPYAAPAGPTQQAELFGSQETLDTVAAGFNLVFWGLLVMVLSGVLIIFGVMAVAGAVNANGEIDPENVAGIGIFILVFSLAFLVGWILDLVGKFMCLAVPPKSRSRGLIVAALVFIVLSVGVQIARFVVMLNADQVTAANIGAILAVVASILHLAGMLLYLLFMKRIAEFIARGDLADRAQTVIVINIMLNVGVVLLVVIANIIPVAGLLLLLLLVLGILSIAYLVLYARLLLDSRKGILGIY